MKPSKITDISTTENNNLFELPAHIAFSQSISGDIVFNLSNSCAQSMTIADLSQQTSIDLDKHSLSYASIKGDKQLRQAIVAFHHQQNEQNPAVDYSLNEDNVLTFSGAQEALYATYQSVLSPGDEVIVFTPCYPSLISMAKKLGAVVKAIPLLDENNWQINLNELEKVLCENTSNDSKKLIVINSPHNPTGGIVDSDTADKILQLAKKHQCYLLADDVSQASNYNGLPLGHNYLSYDKSIVVSVMSKSFGLSGLRVGWALSPNTALLTRMLAIKAHGSICCSSVDEKLAIAAFDQAAIILTKNNHIISENIAHVEKFISENLTRFRWHKPKAGLMAVVECMTNVPIMQWTKAFAEQKGVLVLPCELFGLKGHYFRLGLGQFALPQALKLLQDFFDENDY